MDSPRTVDYFAFPRLSAIAEVLWSRGDRDYTEFGPRLAEHLRRLDAIGVEYRHTSGPKPWQTRPGIPGRPTTREEWQRFTDELVIDIKD
jgi:hexosaminidase